ncbi:MAG: hypothetical protein NVSMB27_34630 [Ktedonobacteraceae bacterium]
MDIKRKSYALEFKLKVVLKSMQRDTTREEVCKKFGISSSMIHRWRKEFQTNAASVFHDKRDPKQKVQSQGYEPGEASDDLKKISGELTVQNEILKKASGLLRKERRHRRSNWRTVVSASRSLDQKPGRASSGEWVAFSSIFQ